MQVFIYERFSPGAVLFKASRDYMIVVAANRKEANELVKKENKSFLYHEERISVRGYPISVPVAVHLDGMPYKANSPR